MIFLSLSLISQGGRKQEGADERFPKLLKVSLIHGIRKITMVLAVSPVLFGTMDAS